MEWLYDDGGRAAAGYRGSTGDCVTRALAIASGVPYQQVYSELHEASLSDRAYMAKLELRYGRNARAHASPRDGMPRRHYQPWLERHGFKWHPTMGIGTGCQVHLMAGELPAGRLVVAVSKHLTAVIDGVVYDTHDPSRGGTRCVYGYYQEEER